MKRLFFALMVAAAALMSSCGPDNGTEGPEPGGEKEFYGFTMSGADVTAIGNDEYIIQSYILDENNYTTRLLSAHVTIPGVDLTVESPLLPEGTYALAEGEIGDTGYYYTGSYYQNEVAETPYTVLITEGEVEIKYTANGYRMTFYADGVDAKTGVAMNDIECRYEGDAELYGNMISMVTAEEGGGPYAIYLGQYTEEANCWVIEASISKSFSHYYDIYVLTPLTNTFEDGIPTGTYPFGLTGKANTAINTYITSEGYYSGSMLLTETSQGLAVYDTLWGGEVNVVNNGDGTYDIAVAYYNVFNLPQVAVYSGEVTHIDNTKEDFVQIQYAGDIEWLVFLGDAGEDACTVLSVYAEEGSTFAGGLTSGTYTVTTSCDPMTIYPGEVSDGAYDGGSAFFTYDLTGIYDIVTAGTMTVDNKGNNAYAISVALAGSAIPSYTYEYDGVVEAIDLTAEAAAVAPLKAAVKKEASKVKFEKDAAYELLPGRNHINF